MLIRRRGGPAFGMPIDSWVRCFRGGDSTSSYMARSHLGLLRYDHAIAKAIAKVDNVLRKCF